MHMADEKTKEPKRGNLQFSGQFPDFDWIRDWLQERSPELIQNTRALRLLTRRVRDLAEEGRIDQESFLMIDSGQEEES